MVPGPTRRRHRVAHSRTSQWAPGCCPHCRSHVPCASAPSLSTSGRFPLKWIDFEVKGFCLCPPSANLLTISIIIHFELLSVIDVQHVRHSMCDEGSIIRLLSENALRKSMSLSTLFRWSLQQASHGKRDEDFYSLYYPSWSILSIYFHTNIHYVLIECITIYPTSLTNTSKPPS